MVESFEFDLLLRHPIPSPWYLELGSVFQSHHVLVCHVLLASRASPARSLNRVAGGGGSGLVLAVRALASGEPLALR